MEDAERERAAEDERRKGGKEERISGKEEERKGRIKVHFNS